MPGNDSEAGRRPRRPGALRGAAAAILGWLAATTLNLDAVLGVPGLNGLVPAALLGGVAGWLGAHRWLERVAAALVAALLLAGLLPLRGAVAALVREDALAGGPADALFVLGGSVSSDGRIGPQSVDRLLEGIRLIRANAAAPRLVVSRLRVEHGADTAASDADVEYLLGVTGLQAQVFTLDPVGSTRVEAERLRDLAARQGWRRIVVVTSPLHTRRACAAVERVGLVAICRPSPERSAAIRTLPGPADRIHAAGEWLYETLARLEYGLRGWI